MDKFQPNTTQQHTLSDTLGDDDDSDRVVCVYESEDERLTNALALFQCHFDGLYSTIREMEMVIVCVFCCDIYVLCNNTLGFRMISEKMREGEREKK